MNEIEKYNKIREEVIKEDIQIFLYEFFRYIKYEMQQVSKSLNLHP